MISFNQKGDFSNLTNFLQRTKHIFNASALDKYGREGVQALKAATPVDSTLTAESWGYRVDSTKDSASITFTNDNIQNGVNIAIILQYGHATRNGGWVEGRDYINPALQPIFDEITNKAWEEVTR